MDVAKIGDLVLSWSTGWSDYKVQRITEVEERKDAWGNDIVMYRGEQVYDFFEKPDLESLSMIDGDFWGCAHLVYAMSDEDYAHLVAADQLAIEKQRAKEMEERACDLQRIIARFDGQKAKPETFNDAREAVRRYNDLHNEGGYGYVPRIVSREERDAAEIELAKIKSRTN